MKGDITISLEDVRSRRISNHRLFERVSRVSKKRPKASLDNYRPQAMMGHSGRLMGTQAGQANALRSTINSLVVLAELPASVSRITEFGCDNTWGRAPESFGTATTNGLDSLMPPLAGSPANEPLRRWAHVVAAATLSDLKLPFGPLPPQYKLS
jgi:hypothetical protein